MKKLIVILVLTVLWLLATTNFLSASDVVKEPVVEKVFMVEITDGDSPYAIGFATKKEVEERGLKVIKEIVPYEVTSPLTGEVIIEKCPNCGHEL